MLALAGVVRDYAWGSTTAIQSMLGREPDGHPAAELWFGAHPAAPSPLPSGGSTLDRLITTEPIRVLGAEVVRRYGDRLPFLLKVLAADRALSLQVHPSLEQAERGFAAEDARGVQRDAPERNYRDPHPKPELLCALTGFDALCGFRPVPDTLRLLDALAIPELASVRGLLASQSGLRAAFTHVLTLPRPEPLAVAVATAAARLTGEWTGVGRAVGLAAADFPGDVGVVLALLLNYVRLEPGEAIYLGAGNVHAYLRGTGVEIMANSDNVLRCGLTRKHLDVPELLKITDFRELAKPRWPGTAEPIGTGFAVPAPDFALHTAEVPAAGSAGPETDGPAIVLCTAGAVRVQAGRVGRTGADSEEPGVALRPGRAAFVLADEPFTLVGPGTVFIATVGSGP